MMDLVEDPRAAGEIRRYHTWAITKEQPVGLHTWQVMRILLTVWPDCPRNLIVYALMHDGGEMSGDIPYPFKLMFPELEAGSVKAENYVRNKQRKALGAPAETHPLSKYEKQVFKCCDNLDMWEFCLREVNMGNRYAATMRDRMAAAVAGNVNNIAGMVDDQQHLANLNVIPAINRYMTQRITMENF